MLALVGTCCVQFETGQTFRPMQTDSTLLANNTQQCWELLALVASVCMGLNELLCFGVHKLCSRLVFLGLKPA